MPPYFTPAEARLTEIFGSFSGYTDTKTGIKRISVPGVLERKIGPYGQTEILLLSEESATSDPAQALLDYILGILKNKGLYHLISPYIS